MNMSEFIQRAKSGFLLVIGATDISILAALLRRTSPFAMTVQRNRPSSAWFLTAKRCYRILISALQHAYNA
jgi:hypothetical protein